MDVNKINQYLQERLLKENKWEITADLAARWLDDAEILKDSSTRQGLPLRNLLRDNKISGQMKRAAGTSKDQWFIRRLD